MMRLRMFVTLLILLWVGPLAFAQAGSYRLADRVERDWAQNGSTDASTDPSPTTTIAQNPGATPHSLPGTAWKIDFGRGLTGTLFRFCRNGRWEIVPARRGSIGAVGKSYTVSGTTLTTVNQDDGMVQKWEMTWQGDILELNDGKTVLKLQYEGPTQD